MIAQGVGTAGRQKKAISTHQRNRILNAVDAQPATASRDHAEIGQFRWRHRYFEALRFMVGFGGRMRESPRRGRFDPRLNNGAYAHSPEYVCECVHWVLFWTIGQETRTLKQFQSKDQDIYPMHSMNAGVRKTHVARNV